MRAIRYNLNGQEYALESPDVAIRYACNKI